MNLIQKIFEAIGGIWGSVLGALGTVLGTVAATDKSVGFTTQFRPECDIADFTNCIQVQRADDPVSRLGGWVPDWFVTLGPVEGALIGGTVGAMLGAFIVHVVKPGRF